MGVSARKKRLDRPLRSWLCPSAALNSYSTIRLGHV
jgi:hypothetical protein